MKVVVLCGGFSTERNVSIASGTKVCGALRRNGHRAVLVDMYNGLEEYMQDPDFIPASLFENLPELEEKVLGKQAPDLEEVKKSRKLQSDSLFGEGVLEICREADVVFIALHGMNGEDGRVQATFEMLGIPYTGSGYLGSAIAMDKILTKEIVGNKGVLTPAWAEYEPTAEELPEIAEKTEIPCVIKTPTGGSSVGVYIIKQKEEILPALRECLKYSKTILVEQFIEGRDFTCAVLEDRALPSVEIIPKLDFYNYENKYQAGATEEICPANIDPALEAKMGEIAVQVHKILGLSTYSRSDFRIDENGNVYFIEVNTLPGMTVTSLVPQEAAAVGISYDELCEMILRGASRS